MKRLFKIVIGALIAVFGVMYALDTLNITQFDISLSFEGWWTMFIILPSLYGIFTQKDKLGNCFVFAVGIYLLLASRGIIEYRMLWGLLVATLIVSIGIKMILRPVNENGKKEERGKGNGEVFCAFSEKRVDYSNENVNIAKVGAVFGGANCNFCDAVFEKDAQIEVFCMFGGAELIIPENVRVKTNTFCLFGGVSDKRKIKDTTEEKNGGVTINGFCLFGGVDIK